MDFVVMSPVYIGGDFGIETDDVVCLIWSQTINTDNSTASLTSDRFRLLQGGLERLAGKSRKELGKATTGTGRSNFTEVLSVQ